MPAQQQQQMEHAVGCVTSQQPDIRRCALQRALTTLSLSLSLCVCVGWVTTSLSLSH